jgi:hypothetical protein
MDSASKHATTGRGNIARWCRLAIYFSVIGIVALGLSARSFASELGERGRLLGQQLGAWQIFSGMRTNVVLNGQHLSLHTHTEPRPVSEVLRDFVSLCGSGNERATAEIAASISARGAKPPAALQRLFVVQDQRGELEGTALCFAGLGDGGIAGLFSRFGRFAKKLDASELGALRYLYLRKVATGTHVIFVTADGPLSLTRLWPSDGSDAEGVEPIAGARPTGSVRFMSAQLSEAPHGFTAYRTPRPAADVLSEYAEQVVASGYEVLDLPQISGGETASAALGKGVDMRVLRRGEHTLIATSMPNGSGSFLSVVQL